MNRTNSPKHTLPTMCLLLVGTGSTYPLDAASQWRSHLEHRSSLVVEKEQSHIDVRTTKEHLENIRKILNPSILELAILLDVSRQAIYKWLSQKSTPEDDKLQCIKTLSIIADTFKDAGIHRAGILLNMKNALGVSLFDLLRAKQPYEEQVRMLIAEAQAMEASYQRTGIAQSSTKPTDDWMSSVSIPAYKEGL